MSAKLYALVVGVTGVLIACAADASLLKVGAGAIKTDGSLDEPEWRSAAWHDDFHRVEDQAKLGPIRRKTSFALLSDGESLHVGVRCAEPDVARLTGADEQEIWFSDSIELYFSPEGRSFNFYQFAMSPVSSKLWAAYFSEDGNIQPDPFAPKWKRAFAIGKDEWTAEVEIPLSAFYMTRNADWKETWLVNVARTLQKPGGWVSWSQLESDYHEPKRFKSLSGFPKRSDADDFYIRSAEPELLAVQGGTISGKMHMEVYCALAGDYAYRFQPGEGQGVVTLNRGWNAIAVPCSYQKAGRQETTISFKRSADGVICSRRYPVLVKYQAVGLKLTCPQYRNNFYPGQCSDKVEGEVTAFGGGKTTLELAGPGFPTRTSTVDGRGRFSFDTRGFGEGEAVLTARAENGEMKRVTIRKLPPTGNQMIWIEDGHLVVNGRPVLRRNMYAEGYFGGHRIAERYSAEAAEFHMTPELRVRADVEVTSLVPGLEAKEGSLDVRPSPEYFAKIDKVIEYFKGKDFGYYYISDEPECRNVSEVYLGHAYRYLCERDPYHPVLMASRGGARYLECADWFETHPYLAPRTSPTGERVYQTPMEKFGDYLDAFKAWNRPDKCVGFLPTCFSYRGSSLKEDYPTFDEYLLSTFAAMMRGGKSLWPYAYHDIADRPAMWDGTKYIFESFEALDLLFLKGKRTGFGKTKTVEGALYELPSEKMMVAVNFTKQKQMIDASSVRGPFREFRGKRIFGSGSGAVGRITLNPFEVLVATTFEHDRGLATLANVKEKIARLERERSSRDNQLLGREADIAVAGNVRGSWNGAFYKLFDGMYEQYAAGCEGIKEPFIEMAFSGFKPVFQKVRIHGWGIFHSAVVSVRQNGEWLRLTPVSRTCEGNLLELAFDKPYSTVKMRIDFSGDRPPRQELDLYEIELPQVNATALRRTKTTAVRGKDVGTMWSLPPFHANVHTNIWVDVTDKPKMLVLDVASVDDPPGGPGYQNWTVAFCGQGLACSIVVDLQPGLFTIRIPGFANGSRGALALYHYGIDVGYDRIAMMERPANAVYIDTSSTDGMVRPGDRVNVVVELSAPCEEISAQLMHNPARGWMYRFPLNGKNDLELKKADKEGRRWTANLTVEKTGNAEPRRVYVKVLALGGDLNRPLWGNFTEGFDGTAAR